jgi:hypothetical protein
MKMSDIVWSRDDEVFNDESLRDLIDSNDFDVGDTVYFGTKTDPSSQWVFADDVIEMIGNYAYDNLGSLAEDYPNVSDDAKKELDALLKQWQEKNCAPDFYAVRDSKKYVLTEKDLGK